MPELQRTETGIAGASILDLIGQAVRNPAKPIMEGLFHECETAGLHGSQESFKTIWTLQLAESLATGNSFLGVWAVPKPVRVFFFETEMSVTSLGARLKKMFDGRTPPPNVWFANEAQLKKFRRAANLELKFKLLNEWLREMAADVLIVDTCNPFFRGRESANDETVVGAFFDHMDALHVQSKLFVRHNHKPKADDVGTEAASRIRGSGQFADVPDLLFELRRCDKRLNSAELEVTKFRHGTKPENLKIWFDAEQFRLISIPPVVEVLRLGLQTREELLAALERRFGIGQRKGDDYINAERGWLREQKSGHKVIFEIDIEHARYAEWYGRSGIINQ